jgi:CRISPR/Cas system CSM-associated protein Csm2 small subunit
MCFGWLDRSKSKLQKNILTCGYLITVLIKKTQNRTSSSFSFSKLEKLMEGSVEKVSAIGQNREISSEIPQFRKFAQ